MEFFAFVKKFFILLYALFYIYLLYFRRLEESEKKRQAMMQAMKDASKVKGPNFTITKKDLTVSAFSVVNN